MKRTNFTRLNLDKHVKKVKVATQQSTLGVIQAPLLPVTTTINGSVVAQPAKSQPKPQPKPIIPQVLHKQADVHVTFPNAKSFFILLKNIAELNEHITLDFHPTIGVSIHQYDNVQALIVQMTIAKDKFLVYSVHQAYTLIIKSGIIEPLKKICTSGGSQYSVTIYKPKDKDTIHFQLRSPEKEFRLQTPLIDNDCAPPRLDFQLQIPYPFVLRVKLSDIQTDMAAQNSTGITEIELSMSDTMLNLRGINQVNGTLVGSVIESFIPCTIVRNEGALQVQRFPLDKMKQTISFSDIDEEIELHFGTNVRPLYMFMKTKDNIELNIMIGDKIASD